MKSMARVQDRGWYEGFGTLVFEMSLDRHSRYGIGYLNRCQESDDV